MKLSGGINTIIPQLVEPVKTLKFSTRIKSVKFVDGKVLVADDRGETLEYDHAVFATEAEVIPYVVEGMDEADRQIFRYFKYEPVDIVVHSNVEHSLSRNPSFWSLLNIIQAENSKTLPQISLLMNNFINAPLDQYYVQTLNPTESLVENSTIINRTRMKRVVFDMKIEDTLNRLNAIQGKQNLWYCGSYAVYGSNLLEEGLISAMNIARSFDVPIPWDPPSSQ